MKREDYTDEAKITKITTTTPNEKVILARIQDQEIVEQLKRTEKIKLPTLKRMTALAKDKEKKPDIPVQVKQPIKKNMSKPIKDNRGIINTKKPDKKRIVPPKQAFKPMSKIYHSKVVSIASTANEVPLSEHIDKVNVLDNIIAADPLTSTEKYDRLANSSNSFEPILDEITIDNQYTYSEEGLLSLARQDIVEEVEFITAQTEIVVIDNGIEAGEVVVESTSEITNPEIVELFQEVEQKVTELEPTKMVEVEEYFEELVTILAEAKSFEVYEGAGEIAETVAVETEAKLTAVVSEIFMVLDIKVEEEQIAYIVKLLITQKGSFSRLVEQESHELGTHEILNHISDLISDGIKKILEPLHRLIGRIVLSSATNPQVAKISF